jgi:3',5'-cyclic AMP phosphodiesterase CpdA
VPTRILHVSDLHIGKGEPRDADAAFVELVERIDPELVIASGDLSHRGRRTQLEAAAALLRAPGRPVLAVPGNHDIPHTLPKRFTSPWAEFERLWETTEPIYASATIHAVGLNSVRPWRHQSGRVTGAQLERVARRFDEAAPGALRVAALHHHLLGAPWRARRKRPVHARNVVLARLVEAGAELVVAGHIHQSAVAERREFQVAAAEGERAVVVAIAPGFGRPRPHRLGEARGLQVYEATSDHIEVSTFVWREDGWGLTAVRRFPRGREPLAFEPDAT